MFVSGVILTVLGLLGLSVKNLSDEAETLRTTTDSHVGFLRRLRQAQGDPLLVIVTNTVVVAREPPSMAETGRLSLSNVPESPFRSLSLLQEEQMEIVRMCFNVEQEIVQIALKHNISSDILTQRSALQQHYPDYFEAVDKWKNQLRMLRTIEHRIRAELQDSGLLHE